MNPIRIHHHAWATGFATARTDRRPQLPLFVNVATLLPVFTPLPPASTVLDRFPGALAVVLRAHGVPDHVIDREWPRPPSGSGRGELPQRRGG